jgi:hypothetical protein
LVSGGHTKFQKGEGLLYSCFSGEDAKYAQTMQFKEVFISEQCGMSVIFLLVLGGKMLAMT